MFIQNVLLEIMDFKDCAQSLEILKYWQRFENLYFNQQKISKTLKVQI